MNIDKRDRLDQMLDIEHRISSIEGKIRVLKADLLMTDNKKEVDFLKAQIEKNEEELYYLRGSTMNDSIGPKIGIGKFMRKSR